MKCKIMKNCSVFSPRAERYLNENDKVSVRVVPSIGMYANTPGMCGGIETNSFNKVVTLAEARKLKKMGYWVVFNEDDPEAEVVEHQPL